MGEEMKMEKTVKLYETGMNNHGCSGSEITVLPLNDEVGVVVSGQSCSSCWQVGHDNSDSPLEIGSVVELPLWSALDWADEAPVVLPDWKTQSFCHIAEPCGEFVASWQVAALPTGHSHNELVNDSGTETIGYDNDGCEVTRELEPQPDCTLVMPSDLSVIGHIPQVEMAYKFVFKKVGFAKLKAAVRLEPSQALEPSSVGHQISNSALSNLYWERQDAIRDRNEILAERLTHKIEKAEAELEAS